MNFLVYFLQLNNQQNITYINEFFVPINLNNLIDLKFLRKNNQYCICRTFADRTEYPNIEQNFFLRISTRCGILVDIPILEFEWHFSKSLTYL